jgi:hypothetical protein
LRILTRTYHDYFRALVEDPRVRLVNDEGRHFLSRSHCLYDVIQLSGVDSYSGTPGAAHVFSENYLYTAEAFDLYLSRLSEHGVISMMRIEHPFPREMLRALVTAVGALRRSGVTRPADHVVTLTSATGNFTTLLVKKVPFTAGEIERLQRWAAGSPYFHVSAAPGLTAGPMNAYQAFLRPGDSAWERAYVAAYPFDISPATDDRPFFFRFTFWRQLFPSGPLARAVPVLELSLVLLLAVIGPLTAVAVLLPLRAFARRGLRTPAAARHALVFAGTGLGYLAIEVAFLQKFGLFLGHPNYALSVVLAALLFTTGLGSLWSERIVRALGGIRFVSYALAAVVLAELLLALPALRVLLALPLAARVGVVALLVAPVGIALGTYTPTALEALKTVAPDFVPWAWGITGIFSVLAPILAVALSTTWGIDGLLLTALPVYLLAGWSLPDATLAEAVKSTPAPPPLGASAG